MRMFYSAVQVYIVLGTAKWSRERLGKEIGFISPLRSRSRVQGGALEALEALFRANTKEIAYLTILSRPKDIKPIPQPL